MARFDAAEQLRTRIERTRSRVAAHAAQEQHGKAGQLLCWLEGYLTACEDAGLLDADEVARLSGPAGGGEPEGT